MTFRPNRKFRRDYNRLFKREPGAANLFLLLCELADATGTVEASEEELAVLLAARFEDPEAYQLAGGPKP